jgi:hypothetical protein
MAWEECSLFVEGGEAQVQTLGDNRASAID